MLRYCVGSYSWNGYFLEHLKRVVDAVEGESIFSLSLFSLPLPLCSLSLFFFFPPSYIISYLPCRSRGEILLFLCGPKCRVTAVLTQVIKVNYLKNNTMCLWNATEVLMWWVSGGSVLEVWVPAFFSTEVGYIVELIRRNIVLFIFSSFPSKQVNLMMTFEWMALLQAK